MTDFNLERLRVEIELKRAALYEHRAALFRIQADLEAFSAEYERAVGAIETEIALAQKELDAAYHRRRFADHIHYNHDDSGLGEFGSFAEYFASRHKPPSQQQPLKEEKAELAREDESREELRAVYRQLARKFHPDTVLDAEEKARLSIIMAKVNDAYRKRDLTALRRLSGQDAESIRRESASEKPRDLTSMSYDELRILERQLDDEIAWTRTEYELLLNSALMRFKIEHKLAQARGHDVFREIVAEKRRILADLHKQITEIISKG
ncbi:MAG: hypothetical protein OHK0023_07230 [Anaerolineae bacterium]